MACSGESLAHDAPGVAYRLGESCAILSDPSLTRITLRGFAVPPEQQGKGAATRLLAAVLAAHPGKNWQMPAVCPEELQPIFVRNGFAQTELRQFQMLMAL